MRLARSVPSRSTPPRRLPSTATSSESRSRSESGVVTRAGCICSCPSLRSPRSSSAAARCDLRPARSRRSPRLSWIPMRYYLTTPIYYVNSKPHIGHAYTTIIGDILVRHQRQRGAETFFLTGVDEHADKVARVAAEQGLTPREFTDQIVGHWQE